MAGDADPLAGRSSPYRDGFGAPATASDPAPVAAWRRRRGPVRATWRVLRQAIARFNADNGWIVAGHIAYMSLFALFPFLIFLLALAGFLGQGAAIEQSIQLALELLPPDVARGIAPAIQEVRTTPHAGLITFSILVALWASSAGLDALRHALNLAYAVRDPPGFVRARLESLLLTVIAAVIVIIATVLLFVVPLALEILAWLLNHAVHLPDAFVGARYLLGIGLLLALVMTLYKVLPNVALRPLEIVPGAVLAWAAWVVVQYAYTLYLRVVPSYSITYGSLGGIIATLFFFYLSALLFIFGAEVNSVLKRRRERREARPKR